MTRFRLHLPLCLIVLIVAPLQGGQEDADVRLEAATHRELVTGDLRGAIDEYQQIAAMRAVPRPVAATALLQMGRAYEKLGAPEAGAIYARVIRDFADQRPIVDQARTRAAALSQVAAGPLAPSKRLLVNHAGANYGKPTRDGKSYLRYNSDQRAFELLDFATGRVRRLTTSGPSLSDGAVNTAHLSNDGRRIAATVHVYTPGTEAQDPRPVDRAELRVFDVGGRGPGRILTLWPWDQLIRFSARTFAWSPRNDRIWLKVMFRDTSAQIVGVDLTGTKQVLKTIPWHDHSQPPSLSRDGRFITYHDSFDRSAPPDIVILATDGSGEHRFEHPANDNKPIFSPDGSGIVFESNRRGARDLWFVSVAGGRPTGEPRLVWRDVGAFGQIEGFGENGALSYYFSSNDFAVYTVPIDLDPARSVIGERTQVPPVSGEMNTGAAYSPDGRELLFFRARGRRVAIRELATGREREFPLGAELGLYATADWCPGGARVVVTGSSAGVGNMAYTVDLADATVRRLPLADPVAVACTGAQEVVYLRNIAPQTQSVLRRRLDTGEESTLFTTKGIAATNFARSPDSSRVAFVIVEPTSSRVVTLPTAGGSVSIDLMKAGAPIDGQVALLRNVAWLADGRRLLVVRFDEEFAGAKGQTQRPLRLWEVPVDGGTARPIGVLPVSKIDGYFAGIFSLTAHPGGRQIAFQSHEGYLEQTWAIDNLAQVIRAR